MDTIKLIKKQIEQINKSEESIFLDSVVIHLERAEFYYELGENDSYYFNDVIYRTNQAFEGGLKEAYKVLAEKSQSETTKETPFKIEKYFEENNIFRERVLELFRNYRNEWRNKSTHDYKLFFDRNEAFIAISNVSSFTYLLMNQIIEKIAFEKERKNLIKSKKTTLKLKEGMKVARGLFDIMTLTLSDIIDFSELKNDNVSESELMGFLKANINSFLIQAEIEDDKKLKNNLRPDLLIRYAGDELILEVKRFSKHLHKEPLISQLFTYLKHSGIKNGIALALNTSADFKKMNIEEHIIEHEGEKFTIRIISNYNCTNIK